MSEKTGVREVEMLGALAAGVALGGVIVFVLLSYFWEWGVIRGAQWWDVMTAFGTIGAAVGAVWVASRVERRFERERVRRALTLKRFLAPKLKDVQGAAQLAKFKLLDMVNVGDVQYGVYGFPESLKQVMEWLDPQGLEVYKESLYVLGDDAPMYAEIFALASDSHADLMRLSKKTIIEVPGDAAFLERLRERFSDLDARVCSLVSLLSGTA